jgi:hypothetical protein
MAITLTEAPFFIVGQERSGTTLLMVMLGCHPRIAVPEVSWWYPRFRGYLHTYGDLAREENFRTLASEMIFGLPVPFWGMPANPRTIVDEVMGEARERSFAGVFCAMMERYARWAGNRPRWGEKTPNNLFFVREIREDFPNAKIMCVTRDGRDVCAEFLQSGIAPSNIFCAAECWSFAQAEARELAGVLGAGAWLDVRYEELARTPETTLRRVCAFLGEDYETGMLRFYESPIARARSVKRDHTALGHPVSDRYIGVHRELLSLREQRIFAAVAGKVMAEAGYALDVEPLEVMEEDARYYRERGGRTQAALLDGPDGRIAWESYHDWLIDRREERRKRGIWHDDGRPRPFPAGHPHEGHITGQRAPRQWKEHFGIKRRYDR